MNIIIPLGGIGKRFTDYGYIKPKPLVKVHGKEIIFWLLDSLEITNQDKVYIPYNESLDNYSFSQTVKSKYKKIQLLPLPNTQGPSETLQLCIESFNIEGKIVLLDGDTWYRENILDVVRKCNDNLTTYFLSEVEKPIYSYITLEKDRIIDIAEKRKISNFANSGCYVFSDAKQTLIYIEKAKKSLKFFISDVIKQMLLDNVHFSSIKVSDFYVLGTPQQVIQFSKDYPVEPRRFVFDLDNTLVTYPVIEGDYSTVEPISTTINYLRNLKKQGHYIIIYTARRMRTHGGNLGGVVADIGQLTISTLEKFKIPYDEIVFGKPYADFYVDDLMINPKADLNKELGYYMENVEPRHFNTILYNEDRVTKISNDEKLEGEAFYYSKVKDLKISKFFPEIYHSEPGKIIIEKISGSNYSTLYINEILSLQHLDNLFSTINEIHSIKNGQSFTAYYDYTKKLEDRYNSFNYSNFSLKKREFLDIKNAVSKLDGEFSVIHGDLVFSNILLTDFGDLKFIDVKGKQGNLLTIYGDRYYDYSKIYQSLIGYDEILLDKKVAKSYKRNAIKFFESKFTSNELIKIKKITKSLLISLVPLHDDPTKQQQYIDLAKSF